MGVAGKKPMPTVLKMLKGTDQPCRINKAEPQPKSDNIAKPDDLSEQASKHWDIVCLQLQESKILTELDVHALAMYCEAYARWSNANDQLRKYGPVIKAPTGYPVQSPYLSIANKAFDQMKAMLTEFGMTPSSRTRVVSTAKSESDQEEFGTL